MNQPSLDQCPLRPAPELRASATYGDYLRLDRLLTAQVPRSSHPDELLFIIQHQTSELWMKLLIHELSAAIEHLGDDRLAACAKTLARVKQIQRQLFEQWGVIETMTPSEFAGFRGMLGTASGIQSHQHRAIEFLLGDKSDGTLERYRDDCSAYVLLATLRSAPSLYDELLRALARRGLAIPDHRRERDWSSPCGSSPEVVQAFLQIYEAPEQHWAEYGLCEDLVDVEESFQLWRFRHLKVVERMIGAKPGTGGTRGISFLRARLDVPLFPELLDVRTRLL